MRQEGLKPKIPGSDHFRQEFPGFKGDAQESLGWIIPATTDEIFWNLSRVQHDLNKLEGVPALVFARPPKAKPKVVPVEQKVPVAA